MTPLTGRCFLNNSHPCLNYNMLNGSRPTSLSVVVIGRNQGKHLHACFASIKACLKNYEIEIIYVDTNSTDNSIAIAKAAGVESISITPPKPSAAIARNVGWKIAQYPIVFFLDGDTLLQPGFVEKALPLFTNPSNAVVCGQRRERFPYNSIYQEVLDQDWIHPTGEVDSCGGDAIIRRTVLEETNGFNGSLIAGEEPELCQRIRKAGYKVIRLNTLMTLHDLNMQNFSQYWNRCFRTGYAYAEVSSRFKEGSLWKIESRHNLLKGILLVFFAAAAIGSLPWSYWPMIGFIIGIIGLVLWTAANKHKTGASWRTCLLYGLHSHFQHIPMLFGQLSYFFSRPSDS